jgi:serine/threonine-protein kinase
MDAHRSLVGSTFVERYQIHQAVGSGGAAVVYRARDLKHDRDVAVKVLHDELSRSIGADRFAQEIGIAAKLTHPNILPLYDSGESDGIYYYVTPFIEGESLRDRIDRERQLPLRDAVAIARAVAAALDCAHARGIVHRDIKPENILIASGQPLVSDFGIARVLQSETAGQSRLTSLGVAIGTPAYMSPEQALGERDLDARSDLYSLGCVLYEMVTGRLPFEGGSAQAILAQRLTTEVPDPCEFRPTMPESLDGLLRALLARLPADRLQTAAAAGEALAAAEVECAVLSGRSATLPRPGVRWPRRRAARRRLVAGLTGAAVVAGALWLGRDTIGLGVSPAADAMFKRLAVLPLANLSGDVKQEFFADGLTDALITELAQLPGIMVISRNSVMQYKDIRKPIQEIARELNVDALVEASWSAEGERVRIMAKLVRGRDEQSVWAASYDGRMGDLLELQQQVGSAVAREIGARFGPRTASRRAVKPESQVASLKGLALAGQWRLEEAIGSLTRAVEIDPGNARAYAALARAYYFRAFFGEVAPLEAFSQMRRAASAALAQDDQLAEAHGMMALVNTHFDYDWTAAEQRFGQALRLSPSNAQVHHDYAHYLLAMGRGPESVVASRHAVELDPANPMLISCLGWHSLFDRQFDRSLQRAEEAQELMPSYWAQVIRGWAYFGQRRPAEAVEAMREAVELSANLAFAQAALAQTLARTGSQREARAILAELLERAKRGYISAYDIAVIYAGLEEKDQAFEWLAKALAERSIFVVHLNWDARLDPLRSDPRFGELVERLGLPSSGEKEAGAQDKASRIS